MFRKRKPQDFQAEIDAHLDLEAEALRADGLSGDEARAAARRALGNRTLTEERFYESNHWILGQHLLRDLRFAIRVLRKEPKFSVLTILGLALGVGVSTAIFGLATTLGVHGTGIRPPDPVTDPSTYVSIDRGSVYPTSSSYPEYRYFQDHATAVKEISAESESASLVLGPIAKDGDAEEVVVRFDSGNFLAVRGFHPALGRSSHMDEEQISAPVALLSYRFWQQRFGADSQILGTTVLLNSHPVTVIGVAPPGFHETDSASFFLPLELRPLLLDEPSLLRDPSQTWLMLNARLQPNVKLAQARAEADILGRAFERENPAPHSGERTAPPHGAVVFLGSITPAQQQQQALTTLGVGLAVYAILLIACSNLASLLLARATVRRRELGVRLSLGASRSRLISQLLTENLLLSTLGGALGVVFSFWLASWLVAWSGVSGLRFQLDVRVLLFGLLLSLVTGFSFGLGPALAATKTGVWRALRAEGLAGTPESPVQIGWSRRNLLVVVPLAASLMLLIGGALLVRASEAAGTISTSFDSAHVIGLNFQFKAQGYDDAKTTRFEQDLGERIAALPNVRSVALTDGSVLFGGACGVQISGPCHAVSPGFFETLGLPILLGRPFQPSDRGGSASVVIVNQSFVRQNSPGQNPIGTQVRSADGHSFTVVGVATDVEDLQHPGLFPAIPTVYIPLDQSKAPRNAQGVRDSTQVIVRTSGDPAQMKSQLRQAVRTIDPALWVRIRTIQEYLELITGTTHLAILVMSGLTGLVLLMAAVGIYALLAYSVSQRTREIGIRMALGARNSEIVMLVMRRTLILIAWGIACGLAGALALGRILTTSLLKTKPPDVLTCCTVALVLAAVSLLASYLPARKALRVNPVETLRCD